MKQIFLLVNVLLALTISSTAQTKKGITVKGRLADSLLKQQVTNATVSLVNAKDSSLVAFTRTDSAGNFYFDQLSAGRYRLSASQVNFHTQWKNFELSAGQSIVELGDVVMKDKSLMQEVAVTTQRPPVVLNGDTLEFNAEAFKTKPNAVVEDMLKKMPGVEVDKEGNIRVNGKRINRVMVNGKDFFNGDPKMATRNLPADALDKVQVFDKQSDQAAFTGIDDGNSEKTINLKLKKDKSNAAFGKGTMAAGNDGRYDGQFNVNKFKGDQQLSAIGMANNTNRQGFSIMDMLNFTGQNKKMMSGGGGAMMINGTSDDFGLPVAGLNNSQGITQTIAGGLNYNDLWNKKTEFNGSYFYNNLNVDNNRSVNRQNILPGNNFTLQQNSSSSNRTESNRVNFSVDQKIDSFNSIKLTSSAGYQDGKSASQSNYSSFVPGDKQLNNGFSNTTNSTEGYNVDNSLLYKHKFARKGRTLSLNATMQYNDSRAAGTQNAVNNFFTNNVISQRDTLNQSGRLNSLTQTYGTTATYTEPLGKRSLLELRSFYNSTKGDLDKQTFDFNKASGKHDVMNTLLSNAFTSTYDYSGAGASFRTQKKKYGYSFGSNLQFATLKSHLKDSAFSINRNYTNLLPIANFNYNFSRMKALRVNYNSTVNQPTVSQLQPVKNISDPLNVTEGNPSLDQEYTHNLSVEFFNANITKRKNFFAFLNYVATRNAIVNNDKISNGARTTSYINTNGVYGITANAERGFRVKKLNTRMAMGGFISYNNSVNFVNGDKNQTGTFSIAPRVSAEYSYKELFDVNLEFRVSYNEAKYSLQPVLNNNYWRQTLELNANLNLPAGFSINNEFTYSAYTGRSAGYNTHIALLNMSASKQVLKSKKGEIKLSAFDLLNQNTGIDRNVNSNYVEDVQYKNLKRYFTLGFTYSLQKVMTGGPRAVIRAM